MKSKLILALALVFVMGGAATAEWVYKDYDTFVGQ